jgi:multicomponent Na+:H+ antiporter subunit G
MKRLWVVCAGAALLAWDAAWTGRLALILAFLLATLPGGSHLLARAAVREAGLHDQIQTAPSVGETAPTSSTTP